jgi:transcriptional regulator with XRE-family HTH domain
MSMPRTFGQLLRHHRVQAGMSQETLAELALLSVPSISNLERDVPHHPRPDTLQRLIDALRLSPADHATLHQAAYLVPHEEDIRAVPATAPAGADASGRDEDLQAIVELLHHPTQRLVTITGSI